ncbi:hypothetical protein GGU11DRAFT_209182 [Lentinula aff. detonsa]|nr:hypothetical protein GGU11DRAFT_209182 [Lentinula aff. detonsa]
MDEAAREAAGTEVPAFLDDDDEPKPYGGASAYGGGYGSSGGYGAQGDWSSSGAGGGGYSDTASHGTYAQPPMSHESYPMHDFGPPHNPGVGVGGIYDPTSAFAGGAAAAGIHHAMSDNSRSNGSTTAIGDSPYPAFLQAGAYESTGGGVGPGGYPPMGRGGGFDNEAIAGGAAGMAGIGRRSSMNATALNRMKSQNSTGALSGPSSGSSNPAPPESYASHFAPGYPGPFQQDSMNRSTSGHSGPGSDAGAPGFQAGGANFSSVVHDAAFGHHNEQPALPNPFSARLESEENADGGIEDAYGGYGSEEEEEQPRKVLKVANE